METHTMSIVPPITLDNTPVGPGTLSVDVDILKGTFSLKFALKDNKGTYFANDLKINWSLDVLSQFVQELLIPIQLVPKSLAPLDMSNMLVAITSSSADKLEIRVGYPEGYMVNGAPKKNSLIFQGIITLDTSGVVTPPPSQTRSALLKVGTRISLVPCKFTGMTVGHFLFGLNNRPNDSAPLFKEDCTFVVREGLVGGPDYISLQPVNATYKDYYVNHFAGGVNISAPQDNGTYKQNSSFFPAVGKSGSNTVTLYSHNFPGQAVRHFLHRLVLNPRENSQQFHDDSSFIVKAPLAK
jgi:alpha-L-arabinofuranosidase B-like protein